MSAEKILYQLKNAELRAGELYSLIGLSQSIARPELSDLFNELAEEEKLHAREIELLQSLVQQSSDAFLQTTEAEQLIGEFLRSLDMLRAHFNQHHESLLPVDLIHMGLDIEQHMVETHGRFFVGVLDETSRRLFQNLNMRDAAHIRKLESFPLD